MPLATADDHLGNVGTGDIIDSACTDECGRRQHRTDARPPVASCAGPFVHHAAVVVAGVGRAFRVKR